MIRILFYLCFFTLGNYAFAQTILTPKDSTSNRQTKTTPYINEGKIAARRAAIQSAILPGLGQINNKVTVWSVGKVAIIYGGFTALTFSYIDNNKYYHIFLDELKYRLAHNDQPTPGSIYASYTTQGLYTAKDVYRRNREIIIFSYVGVYAINLLDAYVSTRLKYFNISEDIAFQIKPELLPAYAATGFNMTPGLKLSLKL